MGGTATALIPRPLNPAGGTPLHLKRRMGRSLLGAASAVHARPSCHTRLSGSRGLNPVLLLGKQGLYPMSYCRYKIVAADPAG